MVDIPRTPGGKLAARVRHDARQWDAYMAKLMVRVQAKYADMMQYPDAEGPEIEFRKALGELAVGIENGFWENRHELHTLVEDAEQEAKAATAENHNVHQLNDPAVREAVLKLTDGKCAYCGTLIAPGRGHNDVSNFVVEHVVPKSKGGPDNIVNFVPACRGCNNAKGDRHVLHFINTVLPNRIAKAGGAS